MEVANYRTSWSLLINKINLQMPMDAFTALFEQIVFQFQRVSGLFCIYD